MENFETALCFMAEKFMAFPGVISPPQKVELFHLVAMSGDRSSDVAQKP